MPNLFIDAGPNGAGKTSCARDFLPAEMGRCEFVNADLIAAGLSPFAPALAEAEVGRIMVRRLRQLAAEQVDFSLKRPCPATATCRYWRRSAPPAIAAGSISFG